MTVAALAQQRPLQLIDKDGRQARLTQAISPEILLHLNVSVFRQLRKFGTSKQRMCAVLNLSPDEYDYVNAMT